MKEEYYKKVVTWKELPKILYSYKIKKVHKPQTEIFAFGKEEAP